MELCGGILNTPLAGSNDTPYAIAKRLGNDPFPLLVLRSARAHIDPDTLELGPLELTLNSGVDRYVDIFSSPERYITLSRDASSPDAVGVAEERTTILSIASADVIATPLTTPSIGGIPPEIYARILIYAYPGISDPWAAPLRADQAPLSHRLVNRQFASIIGGLLPALTFKNPRRITPARLGHLQRTIWSQLLAGKQFNSVSIHVPKLTHGDFSVGHALQLDLDLWQARFFYVTSLMIPWSQSVHLDISELDHTHINRNPSRAFEQELPHMRRFSWRSRTRLTVPVPDVSGLPFSFLLPPQEYSSARRILDFQTTDISGWGAQTPQRKYLKFPWAQLTVILLDCPMSIDDCVAVLSLCDNCLRSLTLVGVNEGCQELAPPATTDQCNVKRCDSLQSLSISTSVDLVPFFERFELLGLQSLSIFLPKPSLFFDFPTVFEFDKMPSISWHSITDLELHCNFPLKSALRLVNLCASLQSLVWGGEILTDDSLPVQITSTSIASLKILDNSFNHVEFTEALIRSSPHLISLETPLLRADILRENWGLNLRHLTLSSPITTDLCSTVLSTFQVLTTANFAITNKGSKTITPIRSKQLRSLIFHVKDHYDLIPLLSNLKVTAPTLLYIYLECLTEQSLKDLITFTAHSDCSPDCLFLNDVQLTHSQYFVMMPLDRVAQDISEGQIGDWVTSLNGP